MPEVSVIIATYNRAQSLWQTLTSLMVQKGMDCSYEILVVDNHSMDDTRAVAESFQKKNPQLIRYVFEPRQGVAYARNAGVANAQGRILAFVDDDVVVSDHWLRALWKCFQETGACAVGGKIERKWDCEPPAWYSEEVGGCLIHQDFGSSRRRWNSESQHMVTANLAFRRDAFEKFGVFREELGRRGEELVGGEDREFYQRLVKAGALVMYEPEALVWHRVEAARLTKEYLRNWFWNVGRTLGHEIQGRWYHAFFIAPVWVWKEWLRSLLRWAKARISSCDQIAERFASEIWLRHYGGILRERFVHGLPGVFGRKACAFTERKETAEPNSPGAWRIQNVR